MELIFGTMCNPLEKMFLPEDLSVQANASPCLLRRKACVISYYPSAQQTPAVCLASSNVKLESRNG